MKFNAGRKELLECLKTMIKAVQRTNAVHELRGFLVEADITEGVVCITASNAESAIQRKINAKVERDGGCIIDAKALHSIIGIIGGEIVCFEKAEEGTVTIRSGTCAYTVQALEAKLYPRPPLPLPDSVVKASGLRSMYAKTSSSVIKSDELQPLSGVHVDIKSDGISVVGANQGAVSVASRRMACGGSVSFTLSKQVFSNLAAVAGDGEIEVGISGSHAVFMKKGVLFCAKRLPGEYVDVDTLISSVKPALTVKTECDELKTALLDICGVATVGNDSSYISLKFGEDAIKISTQNAACGGERTVGCVTIDGEPGKRFHYSVGAMRDALKTVDGSLIMQVDERGYLLVFDRENKYMTVPISQHAVKRKAEAIREKRTKHRAEQKAA